MKFKVKKIVSRIPVGDYKGVILEQKISPDQRFLWLRIEVEGMESILNIPISCESMLFLSFVNPFVDENGEVDTADFIDTEIAFAVKDHEINGTVHSRFSMLSAVMEDENDD